MDKAVTELKLPLQWAYHWERERAQEIYLTQPLGGDQIREYTWREAMEEARRMANHLRALKLPPKSKIAILSKNTAYWIMADLAIWMADYVSVPLYPTLAPETIEQILTHSDSRLLFLGKLDGFDAMRPGIPATLPCIAMPLAPPTSYPKWEEIVKVSQPLATNTERTHDELATIIYTSGSTGLPKGVMTSFGAMAWAGAKISEVVESHSNIRMLSYLPLAHVIERWLVEICSLTDGWHVYFAESLETFVQDIKRARPTRFISVPRLWAKFQQGVNAKVPQEKLDRLLSIPIVSWFVKRKILKGLGLDQVEVPVSGSAPLSQDLLQWYQRLGLALSEGYGMSENLGYSHFSKVGQGKVGYVGHPLPGVDVKISEQGEILIKSPTNMMGYYKAPELTAAAFTEDGFLKTGDRGEIDAEGRLKITGRVKELFKTSKGKYVSPAPIENKLLAHTHIEMVCVAGASFPQPCALIQLDPEARKRLGQGAFRNELETSLTSLLKQVNATLDPHEQMDFVAVIKDEWQIDNGFLTPTLKLKRGRVEDAYTSYFEGWYAAKKDVIWHGGTS